VHVCVDAQAVAGTVSAWTGIPFKRMVADQVRTILKLKDHMEEAIIGQTHALKAIAQRIRTSRANLADRCTAVDTGARNVDHILNGSLLPELSAEFLSRIADGKPISFLRIAVAADGKFAYEIR